MELGYSITSFYPPDVSESEATRRVLDRARIAREAGYDSIETGDHHAMSGGGYLQNVPTAARLTAEFDHVAAMFLLPAYHPLLVAEYAGTIAAFVDRFDLWCAVGGGRQAAAFGVPPEERAARFEESLDLVRRLWSDGPVTFEGEFYAVEDATVEPSPDDPRICVGGSARPAVRRAGRLGDAWVVGPEEPLAAIERKREWFEDAGGGDLIVRREALVLADGERARGLVEEKLADGYRGWSADADWILAGSPAEVAEELATLEDVGVESVVVRPMSDTHAGETLRGVAEAKERL